MDVVLENQLEEFPEDVHINQEGPRYVVQEEDFAFDANADGHYRAMWRNMNPLALWQGFMIIVGALDQFNSQNVRVLLAAVGE